MNSRSKRHINYLIWLIWCWLKSFLITTLEGFRNYTNLIVWIISILGTDLWPSKHLAWGAVGGPVPDGSSWWGHGYWPGHGLVQKYIHIPCSQELDFAGLRFLQLGTAQLLDDKTVKVNVCLDNWNTWLPKKVSYGSNH